MADTIVGDMNPEQKRKLEGVKSGFNQGPGIVAKLWRKFIDFVTGPPGKGPPPRPDRGPDLAESIKRVVDMNRADPQFGEVRDIDGKLQDMTGSMLGGSLSEDFTGGMSEDYGGVPFGERKEENLEYTPSEKIPEEESSADWIINTVEAPTEEDPKVKKAQGYLMEIYGDDAVGEHKDDGFPGLDTEAALKQFQTEYNGTVSEPAKIRTDGNLDRSTLDAITTMAMFADESFPPETEEGSILD